jgi:CcmD family protein
MTMANAENAGHALGQAGPGETATDRSSEFVAVEGGAETTSAAGLLIAGYSVMWALVFGFVWLSSVRQKALNARLTDLEQALKRAEAATQRVAP